MNDLLAPILLLARNEHQAFWLFSHFMGHHRAKFMHDGVEMHRKLARLQRMLVAVDPLLADAFGFQHESSQLFFCYRWLLVLFKREFPYDDLYCIWDVAACAWVMCRRCSRARLPTWTSSSHSPSLSSTGTRSWRAASTAALTRCLGYAARDGCLSV